VIKVGREWAKLNSEKKWRKGVREVFLKGIMVGATGKAAAGTLVGCGPAPTSNSAPEEEFFGEEVWNFGTSPAPIPGRKRERS